jgi:hypothetical protein
VVPSGATTAQIQAIYLIHKENLCLWQLHNNVDAALKQQLVNGVHPMYL